MPVSGGFGLIFEANAVARSIRGESSIPEAWFDGDARLIRTSLPLDLAWSDGEIENERMPHDETRLALEVSPVEIIMMANHT